MENGDLPKIAQVAEPLIELELYLSFPFSNHWTICVVSSCAGPQLHLWENKWRGARIVFYIKWPNFGRDEVAARTSPKWIAVLAFNTILSLFWLIIAYFLHVPFQTEGLADEFWVRQLQLFQYKVQRLYLKQLYQQFSNTRPCHEVTGGTQLFPSAVRAWEACKCSQEEEFILHVQRLSSCELKLFLCKLRRI